MVEDDLESRGGGVVVALPRPPKCALPHATKSNIGDHQLAGERDEDDDAAPELCVSTCDLLTYSLGLATYSVIVFLSPSIPQI